MNTPRSRVTVALRILRDADAESPDCPWVPWDIFDADVRDGLLRAGMATHTTIRRDEYLAISAFGVLVCNNEEEQWNS